MPVCACCLLHIYNTQQLLFLSVFLILTYRLLLILTIKHHLKYTLKMHICCNLLHIQNVDSTINPLKIEHVGPNKQARAHLVTGKRTIFFH